MESVVIAVGSNLGDRLSYIRRAGEFLESLSENGIQKSSIWESEPVGGAQYQFLNCAAKVTTTLKPKTLLKELKDFERSCGREENPVRWGPRVIDLDLIRYSNLVIQQEGLIIPHAEYRNRLFVLLPMQEIDGQWQDPINNTHIEELIKHAPQMELHKTGFNW